MIIKFLEDLLHWNEEEEVLDAKYEPFRDQLSMAGLSEEELRKMDPDDRVAALEQANLDPYDFIYLACWNESYLHSACSGHNGIRGGKGEQYSLEVIAN